MDDQVELLFAGAGLLASGAVLGVMLYMLVHQCTRPPHPRTGLHVRQRHTNVALTATEAVLRDAAKYGRKAA